MPSLRLMFQFIKIHKTAEVRHCQDGASGNPIDDTMIAVNKLTVFFQPVRGELLWYRLELYRECWIQPDFPQSH